jgi:hypothetical protein
MAKQKEFRIGGGKYLCLSCGHTQNAVESCHVCGGDWLYRRVVVPKSRSLRWKRRLRR